MSGYVVRRLRALGALCLAVFGVCAGLTCPPGSGGAGGDSGLSPTPSAGNRPPRIQILSISTTNAVQGDLVAITIAGADAEDAAVARVFASTSTNPTTTEELLIQGGIPFGPGADSFIIPWDTTGVPTGAYNIFAEIDDRTFDPSTGTGNPPIRTIAAQTVGISLPGSQPLTIPPQIVIINPTANLGLSSEDEVTIRYIYGDPDSNVTVTLLLDKDNNPLNDNINNPGDPTNPATNIIILPSTAALPNDPQFPNPADTAEIRTNPRTLFQTQAGLLPFPGAPIAGRLVEYRFTIDFSRIPVSAQPYFLRATVSDGGNTVHSYAIGKLSISALTSGGEFATGPHPVDVSELGFRLAGARFVGFSPGDNLGSSYLGFMDLDQDGVGEFILAARYGTRFAGRFGPINPAPQPGMAYLFFGRRKIPFPPDTDGDGIPDGFPAPPDYFTNPYNANNVGRFGGIIDINSLGSFYRGVTYAMPISYKDTAIPPSGSQDPDHSGAYSAGLTSMTRIDMTGDGLADVVFGLPFGSIYDHHDDDPAEGCSPPSMYDDALPNNATRQGLFADGCSTPPNDDLGIGYVGGDRVSQGAVILVDGTANLRDVFTRVVPTEIAGQFDKRGAVDDNGDINGAVRIPEGVRIRGGWYHPGIPTDVPIDEFSEYGYTVGTVGSFDNDDDPEMLISVPNHVLETGRIDIWRSNNLILSTRFSEDEVKSFPVYDRCPGTSCDGSICFRCFRTHPAYFTIFGEMQGDRFGYASGGGQVNQDGIADILCGAPLADRQAIVNGVSSGPTLFNNGIFYVIFTPGGTFGDSFIQNLNRLEVRGTHNDDRFGEMQTAIQDVNGDNIDDIAFAAERFNADINGDMVEEQDVGYVGIIYGNRPLTGEVGFSPNEVGTPLLAGVRFLGATAGARAGHRVASAGDFNQDGFGDILISAPGQTTVVDGQTRLGVVYLIFGGLHLENKLFNLSQVGTTALPGIVLVGKAVAGAPIPDIAPLDTCAGLGDVDGDGFDDIMIGATDMDFVNPAAPLQRRVDAGEAYLIYGSNFGSNAGPFAP